MEKSRFDEITLDSSYKGFPVAASPCSISEISARNWNVLNGDLAFPLALIRKSALQHNIAWMQDFCRNRAVDIAPHGKTTMSPQLYRMQLEAGAWGISFATVFQLAVGVEAGVRRAIVANEVMSDVDLDGLAHFLGQHPDLRVWFLVDSVSQVVRIEQWWKDHGAMIEFDCLLELGIAHKRTGCRTFDQARDLAQRIFASPALRLGGVECYEGNAAVGDSELDRHEVAALMQRVGEVAAYCDQFNLFSGEEVLVTAGGSAVFDLVAEGLVPPLSRSVRGILRSGCYVTHDHGSYERMLLKVKERSIAQGDGLRPALEVWTMVQSCPEPGLAILTCGKRDISYDLDMPVALRHYAVETSSLRTAPSHWAITALNDQHAYLQYAPESSAPTVGDLICLGISHPCTTFDKWRWMPLVSDDYFVCGAITTHF